MVALGFAGLPADAELEDCSMRRFYSGTLQLDMNKGLWQIKLQAHDESGDFGYEDDGRMETDEANNVVYPDMVAIKYDFDGDGRPDTSFGFRRQD